MTLLSLGLTLNNMYDYLEMFHNPIGLLISLALESMLGFLDFSPIKR